MGSSCTLAISLYKDKGKETPSTKSIMTARLSVSSHKKGVEGREGNIAAKTWGIESPTIMQNATIPPKAL